MSWFVRSLAPGVLAGLFWPHPSGEFWPHFSDRQPGGTTGPLCGDYLLHADHEPTSPQEWEQWFRTVRKAITKQALEIVKPGGHGTTDRNPTRL